jgi:hypothetical protein
MKTYQTGKELYDIGRKYYKDSNHCTVVGLAVSCKVSYGKAFNIFKKLGRITGKGTHKGTQIMAFRELGYELKRVHCEAKTVTTLANHLPSAGQYVAYTRGHMLAVDDGVVKDWTDGRRHRVIAVFQVVKNN